MIVVELSLNFCGCFPQIVCVCCCARIECGVKLPIAPNRSSLSFIVHRYRSSFIVIVYCLSFICIVHRSSLSIGNKTAERFKVARQHHVELQMPGLRQDVPFCQGCGMHGHDRPNCYKSGEPWFNPTGYWCINRPNENPIEGLGGQRYLSKSGCLLNRAKKRKKSMTP